MRMQRYLFCLEKSNNCIEDQSIISSVLQLKKIQNLTQKYYKFYFFKSIQYFLILAACFFKSNRFIGRFSTLFTALKVSFEQSKKCDNIIKKASMLLFNIIISLLSSTCFSQNFTFVERLILPKGSCRRVKFLYTNMPNQTLLTFQGWPQESLQIDPVSVRFRPNTTEQGYVLFCSTNKNEPDKKINVLYYLTHQKLNYSQQGLNYLLVHFIDSRDPKLSPVLLKNAYVNGTCAEFDVVTPGNNGILYYSISSVMTFPDPYLENLLDYCGEFQSLCQNEGMRQVYQKIWIRQPFSVMIEKRRVTKNETHIKIQNDLIEGTSYNICAFYRNQYNDNSVTSCLRFNTDTTQPLLRAHFKFTHRLSFFKLNALLCFLTNYLGAHLKDIVTIDGLSCSPHSTSPAQYYFEFKDKVTSVTTRSENETIIYFDQGCIQGRNRMLQWNFQQMWNSRGEMSGGFREHLEEYNITWVKSVRNLGAKNVGEMLKPKSIGVKYISEIGTRKSYDNVSLDIVYNVSNISSQDYGSVYFIQIMYELQKNKKPQFVPTPRQIIECQIPDQYGFMCLCQRVVLTGPSSKPPYAAYGAPGRLMTSQYLSKVFFVEAGEYPKFPITWKQVRVVDFGEKNKTVKQPELKEEMKVVETPKQPEAVTQKIVIKFGGLVVGVLVVGLSLIAI